MSGDPLAPLRAGGKPALAKALAQIEREPFAEPTLALLDAAWADQRGHAVGITGPPGVGKSTLISALIGLLRGSGRSVGVIAIDPTSRSSGGALLGDRVRFVVDPDDPGIFVRSLAARDRLGGTASLAAPMLTLFRALFDIVIVETVGVGQSETDIASLADTVVLAVQPGSGDSLQFMKAGITEIPDIAVVTKSDLGALAERTRRELEAALRTGAGPDVPVIAIAAGQRQGTLELLAAIDAIRAGRSAEQVAAKRSLQGEAWVLEAVIEAFGRRGLVQRETLIARGASAAPFRRITKLLSG